MQNENQIVHFTMKTIILFVMFKIRIWLMLLLELNLYISSFLKLLTYQRICLQWKPPFLQLLLGLPYNSSAKKNVVNWYIIHMTTKDILCFKCNVCGLLSSYLAFFSFFQKQSNNTLYFFYHGRIKCLK